MMDYISRNGAKVALAKMRSDYDFDYNEIIDKCINRLMQLPIYRQKQKVGNWLEKRYGYTYCSICGGLAGFYENEGNNILSDYCPNCGAKMEGVLKNDKRNA